MNLRAAVPQMFENLDFHFTTIILIISSSTKYHLVLFVALGYHPYQFPWGFTYRRRQISIFMKIARVVSQIFENSRFPLTEPLFRVKNTLIFSRRFAPISEIEVGYY